MSKDQTTRPTPEQRVILRALIADPSTVDFAVRAGLAIKHNTWIVPPYAWDVNNEPWGLTLAGFNALKEPA